MRLLFPIGLAWLAIGVPVVVLYILKVRRRRQVVPTLMFWEQVFGKGRQASLWESLRHWLSLSLQLAMVALLALALADPASSGQSQAPRHYVLVLDPSASMQATDGEPTRFEQARTLAHGLIRSMRERDEATILGAGAQPAIVCGRTHHQPTLHRAIDQLQPTEASGDMAEALRLARAIDADNLQRTIAVITDGQGLYEAGVAAGKDVKVYRCGRAVDNVAITGFAVRSRADNPVELQGMLRLANFTERPVNVQVKLTLDGALMDIQLVDLAAGEEKAHCFRQLHAGGRVLRAELAQPDALMLDNAASTILPPIEKKRVVLVGEGNLFLQSVLESHPWMEVSQIGADAFAASWPEADIWVFYKHVPAELPAGPCLFVDPRKDSPLWAVGEELKNPLVSEADEASALLRHVHLRNCTFHRARAIQPRQSGRLLVRSFENPLLLEWPRSESGPRVVLAIDINQSDLPWRTAFPILVQNVLNDFVGRSEEPATGGAACGESNLRLGADLAGDEAIPAGVLASAASVPWWLILVVVAVIVSVTEWGLHQRRRVD